MHARIVYAVTRRTQEVAIRMALGSPARHVRWLFLKTGVWVVAGGLALGVPASFAVGRLLQASVVRTDARDLVMLTAMVAILATVALVAAVVPTRRATRVEPISALRTE